MGKLATGRTIALAGTAITVIDTSIVMVPNCTAATATFALLPACTDTSGSKKTSVQSLTYFQPKEDPKKTYVGVPRFSKGDSVSITDPRRLARTPLTSSSLSAEPRSSSPVPPPSLPAPPLPSEPLPSLSELPTHGVV